VRARLAVLALCAALVGGMLPAYGAGDTTPARHTTRSCVPLTHQGGQHAWFDIQKVHSQLARDWGHAICSAANGSTINLAIWFIGVNGPDTLQLINDLKRMHRFHDVHVNVIVGKSIYEPGPAYIRGLSYPGLLSALPFAHVMSCYYGCRSSLKSAIAHEKFMTISRTRAGYPAVVESSANWDTEQFEMTRQSGMYFGDDVPLYRAFAKRFRSLAACARGNCAADKADPVRKRKGVWYDTDHKIWRGAAQDAAVYFDPLPAKDDPVASRLSLIHCHGHGRVDVMTLYLTRVAVIHQLQRLQREGCTLHVLVEHPLGTRYRVKHLGERCLGLSHDKVIAVRTRTQTLVLAGSEDWATLSALTHDQQVVEDTKPRIYQEYAAYYTKAARGAVPCKAIPPAASAAWGSAAGLTRANES
jgi:hypothetical protein